MNRSTAYTITESEDGQFSLVPMPLTETVTDPDPDPDIHPDPAQQETSMPDPASDPQPGQSQSLLTLTDIEALSGLKYVTLQRLAQRHADQIPSEGAGRAKRYYPEAVEVFKRLKAETKPGRPAAGAKVPTATQKSTPRAAGATTKPKPGAKRAGRMAAPSSPPVASQATLEMDRAVAAFERAQLVIELETLKKVEDQLRRLLFPITDRIGMIEKELG